MQNKTKKAAIINFINDNGTATFEDVCKAAYGDNYTEGEALYVREVINMHNLKVADSSQDIAQQWGLEGTDSIYYNEPISDTEIRNWLSKVRSSEKDVAKAMIQEDVKWLNNIYEQVEILEDELYNYESNAQVEALIDRNRRVADRAAGALHILEDKADERETDAEEAEWFISQGIELITEMEAVLRNPSAFSSTYLTDLVEAVEWHGTRIPSIDGIFPACRDIRKEMTVSGKFSYLRAAVAEELDERGETLEIRNGF